MVAAVISGFDELSGDYRIVLDSPPPFDVLPVEVELAAGASGGDGLAAGGGTGDEADAGGHRARQRAGASAACR